MRVAIIGAGASGLTAARALQEVGLPFVIYEESEDIGGLWVYREQGAGPAYRSLRTNTSKQITAFSNLPFPDGVPDFPTRAAVQLYLVKYAAASGIVPLIRFGCRVTSLRAASDGRWRLSAICGHAESTDTFDAVLVCSGIFRRSLLPGIPGRESFSGQALHSIDYRVPEVFAERDVLVVGLGSSAADIATDLLGSAGRVTLSVRRGAWIAPRLADGRPLDHRGTRLSLLLPERLRARRRRRLLLGEYLRRGIDAPGTIWRRAHVPFDPLNAPSVTSDDLLPHLMSGQVGVRASIERMDGREVVFADGSRLRPDTVIFCTGYGLDFPFLPRSLVPWTDERAGLYRLVFPPDHPTLGFIGVCRVHGPILPIVEMQARWAARVVAGRARLPAPAAMRAEIARRWRIQTARRDSPIRVPLIPYMDEVANSIGVRPRLWRHPELLLPLLAGPPVAAQYRLDGPNRWARAAEVIRSQSTCERSCPSG